MQQNEQPRIAPLIEHREKRLPNGQQVMRPYFIGQGQQIARNREGNKRYMDAAAYAGVPFLRGPNYLREVQFDKRVGGVVRTSMTAPCHAGRRAVKALIAFLDGLPLPLLACVYFGFTALCLIALAWGFSLTAGWGA